MAGEIQSDYLTGRTLYAQVRNTVGQIWNTVGVAFEAYNTANIADYDIAMTEQGTASGYYAGNMPAAASGTYNVVVKDRAGGSPAESDKTVAAGLIGWNGSAVILPVNVTQAAGIAWASGAITASSIADGAIDRATFAADTGLQTIRSGTAQAGGVTTITLDASASAVTDFYVNQGILLTGGTGVGQFRMIDDYDGTTKVATVSESWQTNPDATTTFAILPVGIVHADMRQVIGNALHATGLGAMGNEYNTFSRVTALVSAFDNNTITAAALAADAGTEIFNAVVTSQLTEAYAADGVAPTLAQAIFLIQQSLHEFAISGTTRTVKKLDGSTTAATFTLDSATAPTSTTRAT